MIPGQLIRLYLGDHRGGSRHHLVSFTRWLAITIRGSEHPSVPGGGPNMWPLAAKYSFTLNVTVCHIKFFATIFNESQLPVPFAGYTITTVIN